MPRLCGTQVTWTGGKPALAVTVGVDWAEHSASVMGTKQHWGASLVAEVLGVGVVWLDLLQVAPAVPGAREVLGR